MSSLIVEVCEIKDIFPHPNADKLDIAVVKGWNCIVQKDSYKVGDWCVFFPPDSVLPDRIIEKYNLEFLKKGGRVGTLKLRGYISQGLVLSGDVLPEWAELGDDLASELGVTKYEVPERHIQGTKITSRRTQNSNFSKYTDIENIKNFDNVFQDGELVVITEKIHGSNIRFGWLPIEINFKSKDWIAIARSLWKKYILRQTHEFVYGSHNVQLQWDRQKNYYEKNIWSDVLKKFNTDYLPPSLVFYGEVFGKGVQELEYDLDELGLVIFDIKDSRTGKYLDWSDVKDICEDFGLPIVPMICITPFSQELVDTCTQGESLIATHIREGCVVKSLQEENHIKIGRKILKSINPEYLLRKNRTEFK